MQAAELNAIWICLVDAFSSNIVYNLFSVFPVHFHRDFNCFLFLQSTKLVLHIRASPYHLVRIDKSKHLTNAKNKYIANLLPFSNNV